MSNTSQKHRNFINEPMGEKDVTELAGIGAVLGKNLQTAGFQKVKNYPFFKHCNPKIKICNLHFQAYSVLGVYLIFKKDFNKFKQWMRHVCNANSKQANDCYQCLQIWCENYL
jgi:barrier-to-autointegration factor